MIRIINYEDLKRGGGWKGRICTANLSIFVALVRRSLETIFKFFYELMARSAFSVRYFLFLDTMVIT